MEKRTSRSWIRPLHILWILVVWARTVYTTSETDKRNSSEYNKTSTDFPPYPSEKVYFDLNDYPRWNFSLEGPGNSEEGEDTSEDYGDFTDEPFTVPLPAVSLYDENPCQNVEKTFMAGDGTIEMTETLQDCNDVWTWEIQARSPDDGIILQFNNIHLRVACTLQVFTFARGSERVEQRKFTSRRTDFMYFDPLLLQETRVLVELNAPYSSYKHSFSTVNISFYAHPIAKLPRNTFDASVPSGSLSLYDCHKGVLVPQAFRCNMVKQCMNNEDEEHCEYTKLGCGEGWAPYKDQCLKMEFVMTFSYVPGHPHPTFPSVAERTCVSKYGGSLAKLPDQEGLDLVGNLLRQSGHRSAVVGLKKMKPVSKRLRHLYRYVWQWGDKGSPVAYVQQQLQRDGPLLDCAIISAYPSIHFRPLRCVVPDIRPEGYVCMRPNHNWTRKEIPRPAGVHFLPPNRQMEAIATKSCADGSLVQTFHRCLNDDSDEPLAKGFAPFHCRYGPPIHYALVCDGNNDCADGSDEHDCGTVTYPPLRDSIFVCESLQKISKSQRCDGMPDCFDGSDEIDCTSCQLSLLWQIMCTGVGCVPSHYSQYFDGCPTIGLSSEGEFLSRIPAVVSFDGYGMSRMLEPGFQNDDGLFQCISGVYIPSFLLNNGELDCQFGEDENIPPENFTCPGFYRCQYSGLCVHPNFVCDGIYQCPYKDDERYCNLPCPEDCICEGYAFVCANLSEPEVLLQARYLDLSGSDSVPMHALQFMESLQFLNISNCSLDIVSLANMSQLRILDLSFNRLTNLSSLMFEGLTGLRTLNLSGNPFVTVLDTSFGTFVKSSGLTSVNHLIITDTELQSIADRAFSSLTQLISLDIQKNQINFYDKDVFYGLKNLKYLLTDDSKLCCKYFHSAMAECVAPVDELSSCSDLLRLDFFRVFLWTFSALAITGNAAVLLYRAFAARQASSPAFRVLVSNLCGADLLMGVYMTIIGIADAKFRGIYVARENEWKNSLACKMAGFLGLLSSEVSAFVICLITMDRLLVLCFPLKPKLHLKGCSSMVVCAIIWLLGLAIAALPLVINLDFYGETSICLPLPITRRQFSGQYYAFGVYIILNFVLFILIGMGQACIFRAISNASKAAGTRRRQKELTIARRLFLVVLTDFCCWFPIGLMGLLAFYGIPIPGEVNVWAAIFILPLNSALNPFLYTLNTLLEKRRAARLQQRTKKILGNLQSELPRLQPSLAEEVVRVCIRSRIVKKDVMLRWLNLRQDSNMSCVDSEISTEKTSSFVLPDNTSSGKISHIS